MKKISQVSIPYAFYTGISIRIDLSKDKLYSKCTSDNVMKLSG